MADSKTRKIILTDTDGTQATFELIFGRFFQSTRKSWNSPEEHIPLFAPYRYKRADASHTGEVAEKPFQNTLVASLVSAYGNEQNVDAAILEAMNIEYWNSVGRPSYKTEGKDSDDPVVSAAYKQRHHW